MRNIIKESLTVEKLWSFSLTDDKKRFFMFGFASSNGKWQLFLLLDLVNINVYTKFCRSESIFPKGKIWLFLV